MTENTNENDAKSIEFFRKGDFCFKSQQYQEAIDFYNKSIQLNPNLACAFNNKGNNITSNSISLIFILLNSIIKGLALRSLYKFNEAIKCFDKAIDINKNDSHAFK